MRAYHRVDPLMDERKSHYSPAQLGAFLKVQLVAGRQKAPGFFRSLPALRGALPAPYERYVGFLVSEGDLVIRDDGTVYVDGWNEWQEGDLTVGERMARLRNRKRNGGVTDTVSPTVSQASPAANANANANATRNSGEGSGEGRDGLPHIDSRAASLLEELTGRTLRQAGDRNLTEYDRQIEDHGLPAVIAACHKAAKALPPRPTARQLVWSARTILEPFGDPAAIRRAGLDADAEAEQAKRAARLQADVMARRIEAWRHTGKWDAGWGPQPEGEVS